MKSYQVDILSAIAFSPEALLNDWTLSFSHGHDFFGRSNCPPEEKDFVDIEWNAEEAMRRCSLYPQLPLLLRELTMERNASNAALLFSSDKLIQGWQQALHPAILTNIERPQLKQFLQVIQGAIGYHKQARIRFDSLSQRNSPLQQFSVRQWRLYWFLSRALADLEAVANGCVHSEPMLQEKAVTPLKHIQWHTAQAQKLLSATHAPSLLQRIRTPLLEINRLCSMTCIYHAKLLRIITQSD